MQLRREALNQLNHDATTDPPPHHLPNGRFWAPWTTAADDRGLRDVMRWMWQRRRAGGLPPRPTEPFPRAEPRHAPVRCDPPEVRLTWVGHATTLIQMGGLNILTDPIWSRRASPRQWFGPERLEAPGVRLPALPPIDAVLLSHDHYDHLDDQSVRRLRDRFPAAQWLTPLGYADWFARRRVDNVSELDWEEYTTLAPTAGSESPSGVRATALPAQHWTRRTPRGTNRRLWCSWVLRDKEGRSVYFAGDSGYCQVFREIGSRFGPFDAALMPIGAYEPRWFMKTAHMNPEEAVQTYRDLGGSGILMGIHWGTFQLTDEPMQEPPERARSAWASAGLPEGDLWIPAFGETRIL